MRTGRRVFFALALPAVLLVTWWVTSIDSESFFFPPLTRILGTFEETWFQGRLVSDALPSIARLAGGYSIALMIGVTFGVLFGLNARLREFFEPVLDFMRGIPVAILVPIFMIFAGIGTEMKLLVIAFGCLWPILLNTIAGVRGIDEVLRDTADSYRFRGHTKVLRLVLRGASPQIFTGARQSLSIGIILMVVSEMFAANNGLGFAIVQFQREFSIPEMWSGIILLGILGVTLSMAFRVVEHFGMTWYRGLRARQESE